MGHALEVGDTIHLALKDSSTMLVTWTRRPPVLVVLEQASSKAPIGARIKIYREPMKTWYRGRVLDFDPSKKSKYWVRPLNST